MDFPLVRLSFDYAVMAYPHTRRDALRRRALFLLRCLVWRRSAYRWFQHIDATQPLRAYVASHPSIAIKPFSRYMRYSWRMADRLNCIVDHYGLMFSSPMGRQLLKLCSTEETIAVLRGRSGAEYNLVFTACALHLREGEVLIELRRDMRRVCCIAGTFCKKDGQLVFLVGTLQGAKGDGARDFTREVTKDLHQLRPRDLAMTALQSLTSAFGVSAILAPSQKRHIHAAHAGQCNIKADFDDLWTDLGGEPRADGEFALPLETHFKPIEEIASKKRAETLRRYALKHQLANDIRAALGQPAAARFA